MKATQEESSQLIERHTYQERNPYGDNLLKRKETQAEKLLQAARNANLLSHWHRRREAAMMDVVKDLKRREESKSSNDDCPKDGGRLRYYDVPSTHPGHAFHIERRATYQIKTSVSRSEGSYRINKTMSCEKSNEQSQETHLGPRGGKESPEAAQAEQVRANERRDPNCVLALRSECSAALGGDGARGGGGGGALCFARSPPPPLPPLNGAVQLCTLQWEGEAEKRRPRNAKAAARAVEEEEEEEKIGCLEKAAPCANPTATCTTKR